MLSYESSNLSDKALRVQHHATECPVLRDGAPSTFKWSAPFLLDSLSEKERDHHRMYEEYGSPDSDYSHILR